LWGKAYGGKIQGGNGINHENRGRERPKKKKKKQSEGNCGRENNKMRRLGRKEKYDRGHVRVWVGASVRVEEKRIHGKSKFSRRRGESNRPAALASAH